MKKDKMTSFVPLLFGMAICLVYILIYRTSLQSPNFLGAALVFFTAMGLAAIILLLGKDRFLYYFYLSVSLVFPLLIMILAAGTRPVEVRAIVIIHTSGIFYVAAFVAVYVKKKSR